MTPRRVAPGLGWALVIACILAAPSGSDAGQAGAAKPAPEMRQEIVPLKYIDAADMLLMLEHDRGPNGSVTVTRDASRNTVLLIRDTPANVDKMLALIQRMDIRPAEVLFTVDLISGTSVAEAAADPVLAADPALKDLRKLMGLRSFALIGSSSVRTSERETAQVTLGRSGEYGLSLKPRVIKSGKEERIQAEIRFGYASGDQPPPALIESVLNLKPGERTVVGVSKPHDPSLPGGEPDRGLILLISANLVK